MHDIAHKRWVNHITYIMKEKAKKDYNNEMTKRSAHAKALGTLQGYFKVDDTLPSELKVGIFETQQVYPAWIRISSSSAKVKKDSKKDVIGFAIKLQAQDFILVSTKHMPLRGIKGFHSAICCANKVKPLKYFVQLLKELNIKQLFKLITTLKHETSPLDSSYFSITPYRYGDRVVKYCIVPSSSYKSKKPLKLTDTYLRDNLKTHLEEHEATFDFMIQFKKDEMSIEDASEVWDETKSPFIKVGEIIIKPQNFDTPERKSLGEKLAFSPGHALIQHAPLGELNLARVAIYKNMSSFRKRKNSKLNDFILSDSILVK
ncbi:MAG: hypothetical protein AB9856_07925 [Cellulosilyticaceae bacterium]